MEHSADVAAIERAWETVSAARHLVVLTGAGISTDSGIPDFRGPNGVWTKDPSAEKLATFDNYVNDPEIRRRSWQSRLRSETWNAVPNAGHLALVEFERRGVLDLLVTQNIDGLHLLAGHLPEKVVEIHGTMRWIVCLRCGNRLPTPQVLERVKAGETDPACRNRVVAGTSTGTSTGTSDGECGGILKSDTISFGQDLVAADLYAAERAARSCDVMLAVGSTLTVYPAAALVPSAKQHGASVVIVNGEPTGYDMVADVVVRSPISEALPLIAAEVRPLV
jgi:NAD-dependent deacetylase